MSFVLLMYVTHSSVASPTGEQFLSCKEASSFLRSYFEAKSSNQPVDQGTSIVEQAGAVASRRVSYYPVCL